MKFDPSNKIIMLCAEGMDLESKGQMVEASQHFLQAWNEAENDFEKFTAAHYVARHQPTIKDKLIWDETALNLALVINDDTMKANYPSLYLNIAKCYEDLNDLANAGKNYQLALSFANQLPDNGYGNMIKAGIKSGIARIKKPAIAGIAPFFIVKDVPAALSFYRDRLGFDITFQGPSEDDIFFGIVQRGAAMIMLKSIGVDPVPNYTRDIKKGIARWDAYLYVPDPDALAAEFSSRNVEFFLPLNDHYSDDGLRGFEIKDADGYLLYFGRTRDTENVINEEPE